MDAALHSSGTVKAKAEHMLICQDAIEDRGLPGTVLADRPICGSELIRQCHSHIHNPVRCILFAIRLLLHAGHVDEDECETATYFLRFHAFYIEIEVIQQCSQYIVRLAIVVQNEHNLACANAFDRRVSLVFIQPTLTVRRFSVPLWNDVTSGQRPGHNDCA